MKTFFVVLATVGLHLNVLYAEDVAQVLGARKIVMDRPRACKQPVNLRPIFDDFHNTLRLKVALGIPLSNTQHVQKRLMYGLIYDCTMEKEADKVVRNPTAKTDLPVVREYGGSASARRLPTAVENGFKDLIQKDRKALIQIIYPKATRFACARTVKRGTGDRNRIDVACVYDKKYELTGFDGKGPCKTNADCTYFGGNCQNHLCYVPLNHP
ncbi:hypothetical protein Y032_0101g3385 [Ancylostoma ceylanicum]|uniref:SCP domain-containing protein n=1 Tax=Ancylostoma ceylanicum TaxID=53326 RepID=A0A016THV3_9BILA|nr:hypothetical protein Y032_0101g3385 [Ancylostoma ceylanicum]